MQMNQSHCLRELRREIKRVPPTTADPLDYRVTHAVSRAVIGMVLDAKEPLHNADEYLFVAHGITQQLRHYVEDRERNGWESSPHNADQILHNIRQAEDILLHQSIITWGKAGQPSPSL